MRLSACYSIWHIMLSIKGYIIVITIIIKFTENIQLSFFSWTLGRILAQFSEQVWPSTSHIRHVKFPDLDNQFYRHNYFMLTVTLSQAPIENVWLCLHIFKNGHQVHCCDTQHLSVIQSNLLLKKKNSNKEKDCAEVYLIKKADSIAFLII